MKKITFCATILASQISLAQMPDLSKVPTSIPQVPAADKTDGSSAGAMDTKSMMKMASDKAVIHLNSATPAQLEKVPGLSAENASAIVAARPFKSVAELAKVKGIGPALYAKIKPYVKL